MTLICTNHFLALVSGIDLVTALLDCHEYHLRIERLVQDEQETITLRAAKAVHGIK